MSPRVLIVDDDQVWLRLLKKKLDPYADIFFAILAESGQAAVEVLRRQPISLVVTDLQMPGMDGLALLAYLSEFFPDIPVIIVTAYSTPDHKKAVFERGAAGYLEKPFVVEDLARRIATTLKKESEGGTLHSVQLHTFAQLLEMEQKTCTIRVIQKATGYRGVLFFRNGELLEARVTGQRGAKAAYTIFAWGDVVLSIEDDCVLKERRITEDLQAILLESMRRHDEEEEIRNGVPPSPQTDPPLPHAYPQVNEGTEAPADDPVREVRAKLESFLGGSRGIEDLYPDANWDPLIASVHEIGRAMEAGEFKGCAMNVGKASTLVLLPGATTMVATLDRRIPWDRILNWLLS